MPPEQQAPQQPMPQPMPPQQPMQQPVQQFAPQPMQQPVPQPIQQMPSMQQGMPGQMPMNGYGPMQAQQMPSGGLALIKSPFVLVLLAGSLLAILGSILKWISFKSTNATFISLADEQMNSKYTAVIGISLVIVVSTLAALKLQKRFAPISLIFAFCVQFGGCFQPAYRCR